MNVAGFGCSIDCMLSFCERMISGSILIRTGGSFHTKDSDRILICALCRMRSESIGQSDV